MALSTELCANWRMPGWYLQNGKKVRRSQKRVYELTKDGLILLDNWASVIRQNEDRLISFLETYESAQLDQKDRN